MWQGRYYDNNNNNNNNNNYKNKKSGQVMMIPRFGEWEEANEMPITQYFDNPTQAGLLRHHFTSGSSASTTTTTTSSSSSSSSSTEALKLASHHPRQRTRHHLPSRQTMGTRGPQRRVRDVSSQTDKYYVDVNGVKQFQNDVVVKIAKPVDEDLYKISPDLIYSSTRRKKMSGFLACLVPCSS
ncbi:unnamed protein product [Cochlearia groenlandica]